MAFTSQRRDDDGRQEVTVECRNANSSGPRKPRAGMASAPGSAARLMGVRRPEGHRSRTLSYQSASSTPLSGVSSGNGLHCIAGKGPMQNPLSDEIRKYVADCIQNGSILRVGNVGQRLADAHPDQGFSPDIVCEMLLEAGIAAGVPIELGSPRPGNMSDTFR